MRTAYQYTITLPAMFLAPLALAHEGHGYTSAGNLFHLAEPIHLLPKLLCARLLTHLKSILETASYCFLREKPLP